LGLFIGCCLRRPGRGRYKGPFPLLSSVLTSPGPGHAAAPAPPPMTSAAFAAAFLPFSGAPLFMLFTFGTGGVAAQIYIPSYSRAFSHGQDPKRTSACSDTLVIS